MPELPEVESLRLSLIPFVVGQKINKVKVLMPKLVAAKGTTRLVSPEKTTAFINGLETKKILSLDRVSKNIIFKLNDGGSMIVHLKMTGQLVYKNLKNDLTQANAELVWGGHPIELSQMELPNKHSHIIFELENGTLYYNDIRQFGYLLYYPNQELFEVENHFYGLGKDPFDPEFSLDYFTKHLKKQTGNLKKVFLDGKVVVGLGNIYADEVAFAAKIKPMRKVQTLTNQEIKKLYLEINRILSLAIELGGSSVANYLLADGSRGNYAREHKVYNRGGQDCPICDNQLLKVQLAGRTTVYCDICQK